MRLPDKLDWYWQRLQAMSAPEVTHRATEQAAKRHWRHRNPPTPSSPLNWSGAASALGDIVAAWASDPEVAAYAGHKVKDLLAGHVEVMGQQWELHEASLDWHYDPVTGTRFPLDYCFDIDYRQAASPGEVRVVFELNRLLWLLGPAAVAANAGDEQLAALCDRIVDDWLRANPLYRGVSWSSGIELAHHVLVLVTLEDLVGRVIPDVSRRRRRMERVRLMVDWIERFPSLYSSANNHRICELAGMLVGYLTVGGAAQAEIAAVAADLDREAAAQHSPDGLNAEQAAHYSAFVLEWLTICRVLASSAARPMPDRFSALTRRGGASLLALTDCRGNTVGYGDDDDAWVFSYVLPGSARLAKVIELAAPNEEESSAALSQGARQLGDSWYTVARYLDPLGETHLVFDHAPLGFGLLSAHGHADALSIWLSIDGMPLFVEAGTYHYHAKGEWREALRSTRTHNTLTVEGLDSSIQAGKFNWRRRPRAECRLLEWRDEPNFLVEAEHDGYESRLGTRHVRRVERPAPGLLRITDRLSGVVARGVTARFLLAPDVGAERQGSSWLLRLANGTSVRLKVSKGYELDEVRGPGPAGEGWFSPHYGQIVPATTLRVQGDLGGGRTLVTELDLTPGQ